MRSIFKWFMEQVKKEPEKKKETIGVKAGRAFILFMIVMFIFTIVSRVTDSFLIAKVQVDKTKQNSIKSEVKGNGVVGADVDQYLEIYPGIRIVNVYVKKGDVVEKGTKLFQYDAKGLEKAFEKSERTKEMEQIIKDDGVVTAMKEATILECNLESGIITVGNETLAFAGTQTYFEAQILKEDANKIKIGDRIQLERDEEWNTGSVVIERMEQEGDTQMNSGEFVVVSGKIEEGKYKVGSEIKFSVNNETEVYPMTIPVQALRMESNDNYYVLVIESKNTIMGEELIVSKVEVTVLNKDYRTAAIEGSLTSDQQIVISSNKNISAGDRVRLVENETTE